jgi:hypothetical protein
MDKKTHRSFVSIKQTCNQRVTTAEYTATIILATNRPYRSYQCHDFKAYHTTGVGVRQSSLRTVSYQSQGVNRTVGDIIFYSKLVLDIHFYGIADPASVKRLVDALRKQQPV